MGDIQGFFVPAAPKNLPIRPLDKGMILDMPSTLIPAGAALVEKNLWVIDSVLKRRPGLVGHLSTATMSYPVHGAATVWSVGGNLYNLYWDKKFLYRGITSIFTPIYWVYNTGTVRYTAGKYTLRALTAGTNWTAPTNLIQAGDIISIPGVGKRTISGIQARTQLLLYSSFASTGGPTSYAILRAFKNTDKFPVDSCVTDNKIIFADGGRPLYYSTGATFGRYATGSVTDAGNTVFNWRPRCVAFFANRVWAANTIESNYHRQRVRWSQVLDHDDFRDASGNDTQWLDLPYSPGQIRKLAPLSNILMIYLDDAIYSGIQTNIPTLPISPQRVETGGIGLTGTKGIVSFMGAHFFVGQDDIYALTSKGIERIGTAVVRDTIRKCTDLTFVRAAVDPGNDRIVFGFPESGQTMTKIWSYFYKAKAWTYDEISASSMDYIANAEQVTWDNFASYSSDGYWTGIEFSAWDAITGSSEILGTLILGQNSGRVYSYSSDGAVDAQNSPVASIPVVFESGDMDLDMPDDEKTWLRLGVKLRDITATAVTFTVSVNQYRDSVGRWKAVGTLTIPANDDEGYVNFRVTSSQLRFKLESSSAISPYNIQELVLRVRQAGQETARVAT